LIIKKQKELKLMKFIFMSHLNTFGSNKLLTFLKKISLKNMTLTKVIHFDVVKSINA